MSISSAALSSCAATGAHSHCITCSDEGIPVRVLGVDQASGLARCVDAAGTRTEVEIALIGEVAAGERLLVHAGTAIARADGEDPA